LFSSLDLDTYSSNESAQQQQSPAAKRHRAREARALISSRAQHTSDAARTNDISLRLHLHRRGSRKGLHAASSAHRHLFTTVAGAIDRSDACGLWSVEEKLRPRKAHTRALPRRPARAKLRGTAATPCPFRQDASVMATPYRQSRDHL
jgi:hypothetical protein